MASTLLDLTRMDQVPVGFTLDALQSIRNSQATDDVNLAELQRKAAHEAEMDPLRIEEQGLRNTELNKINQKHDFTLRELGRKDALGEYTFDAQKDATLQKLLAEAGAEKGKIFEQELFNKIQQTRPGSPEHKTLLGAIRSTRKFLEEQAKHEHAMEVARINAASRENIERMGITAGKYDRNRATAFEDWFNKLKSPFQKYGALVDEATKARQGGAPELADAYMERARMLQNAAAAEIDALRRGQQGAVDLGSLTNLPTRTAPGIAPPATPVAPGPVPTQRPPAAPAPPRADPTVSGGGTRVKIIGPDGKPYTVPKEELQDAIKEGYRVAR